MNYGIFAGRLGRDANLRSTPSGKDVATFSLAVVVGWGENKETLWVNCSLWGARASKLAIYLNKGCSVTVAGRVGIRTYQDKAGTTKAEMTCDVQDVTLMGGGDRKEAAETPAKAEPSAPADFSDDVPFN